MKNIALSIPLLLLAAGCEPGGATSGPVPPSARPPVPSADPTLPSAPDFTLKDLTGKDVSLSSLLGKPVLLVFWAVG